MSQAPEVSPATAASGPSAAIPAVPTNSSVAPQGPRAMEHHENDVVSMYITLFGVRTPFILTAPEPVPGTEPQEFRSKLWLLGNGQHGSIGLPLFFSEYFAFDESAQSKQNRDYRNSFFRKIFWSIASIIILLPVPLSQILYLQAWDSAIRQNNQYLNPYNAFQKLYTPIWNKRVVVNEFYQHSLSNIAFFNTQPEKVSQALNQSFEIASSYNPSTRYIFSPDSQDLDFHFNVAPVPGYYLNLRVEERYWRTLFELNVTEFLETSHSSTWKYKIPRANLRSDITLSLHALPWNYTNGPRYRELNWIVDVSGQQFGWDISSADHICQAFESECSYELKGLFSSFAYVYSQYDTNGSYFRLNYDRRIATFVAYFGVMVFFFGAILHALWALWFYNISLKDRVKWMWRKKVPAGVALNADEERPILGVDDEDEEEDVRVPVHTGPTREGDL
ncbi:hypothetical protein HDU97_010085 [Phlyctochytrium planicorne]|nr:hypothetical protein HDU97_010085 [Phlyctochytrium planicorne]